MSDDTNTAPESDEGGNDEFIPEKVEITVSKILLHSSQEPRLMTATATTFLPDVENELHKEMEMGVAGVHLEFDFDPPHDTTAEPAGDLWEQMAGAVIKGIKDEMIGDEPSIVNIDPVAKVTGGKLTGADFDENTGADILESSWGNGEDIAGDPDELAAYRDIGTPFEIQDMVEESTRIIDAYADLGSLEELKERLAKLKGIEDLQNENRVRDLE